MHSGAIKINDSKSYIKTSDPEIHNLQKFRDLQINRILLDCERRKLPESKNYE
jgi:hypothetical protein